MDFTGAQMVLTLKLISVAVCYQDGLKQEEVRGVALAFQGPGCQQINQQLNQQPVSCCPCNPTVQDVDQHWKRLQCAGPYCLSAEPQADRTAQSACLHVLSVRWRQPPGWSVLALQKNGISFA